MYYLQTNFFFLNRLEINLLATAAWYSTAGVAWPFFLSEKQAKDMNLFFLFFVFLCILLWTAKLKKPSEPLKISKQLTAP